MLLFLYCKYLLFFISDLFYCCSLYYDLSYIFYREIFFSNPAVFTVFYHCIWIGSWIYSKFLLLASAIKELGFGEMQNISYYFVSHSANYFSLQICHNDFQRNYQCQTGVQLCRTNVTYKTIATPTTVTNTKNKPSTGVDQLDWVGFAQYVLFNYTIINFTMSLRHLVHTGLLCADIDNVVRLIILTI